ncbi:hypothetical protein BJX76DRAFT_357948 [Aspergillus varians]
MKLISVALAALSAATVQGAALPEALPEVFKRSPDPLAEAKVKRAVDAVEEVKRSADAMAEAKLSMNRWCAYPGQVCGKAKRAIDAIDKVERSADAVAEAMAFLNELTPEEFQQVE